MLQKRVIPCLLLREGSLVKTIKFNKFNYIGDPANTIRIFNELEADEIILLDITASSKNKDPDYKIINEVSNECFMPLTYGGGVNSINQMKKILKIGVEKISINTSAVMDTNFITEASKFFGKQCVVGSIDFKRNAFGKNKVYINSGKRMVDMDPVEWAIKLEKLGVGELIVTSIENNGTWSGYDCDVMQSITDNVSIPVVANGGAGSLKHIYNLFKTTNSSAAAVGSFVVYQKKNMGVLINFPEKEHLLIQ